MYMIHDDDQGRQFATPHCEGGEGARTHVYDGGRVKTPRAYWNGCGPRRRGALLQPAAVPEPVRLPSATTAR